MPVQTVTISGADLKPGHVVLSKSGPSRIETVVPSEGRDAVFAEHVSDHPRRTTIKAHALNAPQAVTARSHAYVQSQAHRRDTRAAQKLVARHKQWLHPLAADLATGAAVSLRPLADALSGAGLGADAALLRRLPGLRVQIDPDKGLLVTDRPAGYTSGPAQTWNNLQGEARSRRLLAFVDAASPPGSMDVRFRSAQSGEDVGLLSRVDLKTGAAKTSRAADIDTAASTLDTARQRAELGNGWKQTVMLAHENALLRPDLPHVEPAARSQITQVEDRRTMTGRFVGVSVSINPDRMLVHIARDGGEDRVSIPRDAISRIPADLSAGSSVKITYESAVRGV